MTCDAYNASVRVVNSMQNKSVGNYSCVLRKSRNAMGSEESVCRNGAPKVRYICTNDAPPLLFLVVGVATSALRITSICPLDIDAV